ncbi:HAD family hydrolase, partial [Escherichia marmotae]|nr:HAD family hydrolase [Escherichia marmotae]
MKRLIAFDLDGTLAPSKQMLTSAMAAMLARL